MRVRTAACVALLVLLIAGVATAGVSSKGKYDFWKYRQKHRHRAEILGVSFIGMPRLSVLYAYLFDYDEILEPLFDVPGVSFRFWWCWLFTPHLLVAFYTLKFASLNPYTVGMYLGALLLAMAAELVVVGLLVWRYVYKPPPPVSPPVPQALETPTMANASVDADDFFVFPETPSDAPDSRVVYGDAALIVHHVVMTAAPPIMLVLSYTTVVFESLPLLNTLSSLCGVAMLVVLASVPLSLSLLVCIGAAALLHYDFPSVSPYASYKEIGLRLWYHVTSNRAHVHAN